ncbi:MAG: heparinase II/III family protein [Alphaproteobacteria bacterium]
MVEPRLTVARMTDGLRALAYGSPIYSLTLGRSGPRDLALVPPDPWPGDAARGAALVGGEYGFAGETVLAEAPLWMPVGMGGDFLAELHGFEWLRDLRAAGGDAARRHARALVGSWIAEHDTWHSLLWRPDVLGLRMASWLGSHDFFCASADDGFRARVFASLARQLRHLTRALPGGLAGAPLLVALKGLVYGTLCLPGDRVRLDHALALLERELVRQVLPDGCHVQRNPALHLTALRHLIDLRAVLRAGKMGVPEALQHAIDRMAPALRFFRHGDGGLALFNGAQQGEPVLIDTVLAQADARGRPLRSARHSGFERVLVGRTLVLMDAGNPAAAGLDRGAHAGTLAFELSVGRERMIVNCGARAGAALATDGPQAVDWDQALRGTAAHSTVTVGATNSSELVPGGGLGRRPRSVTVERDEDDGAVLIDAAQDGYRPVFGITHRRRLYLSPGGDDLRGEDTLTGGADRPFAVRFHLHPSVQASTVQGGAAVLIRLARGAGWRLRASGGEVGLEDSIYVGEGGAVRRTSQVVITGRTGRDAAAPTVVKWALKRERKGYTKDR